MMRLRRQLTAIGIDWGGRSVKAVQLTRTRGEWNAHATATIPLSHPDAPADAGTIRRLHDVLHRRGFSGTRIVLAAPTSKLEVEVFDLPPRSSGAPLEQFARTELARSAKMEPNAFEMACWDLPAPARATGSTSVMAIGLRHTDGEALVQSFEAEGLQVSSLDTRALALARACSPIIATGDVSAVLDLGWNAAFLVLICNNVVIYQRALADTGLCLVHRHLTGQFGLAPDVAEEVIGTTDMHVDLRGDDARVLAPVRELLVRHIDAVLAEVDVSLAYARHRYPDRRVTNVLLVGGGASIPGLAEHVADRLHVTAHVTPAEELAKFADGLKSSGGPALVAALGLARTNGEAS